MIIIIIIIIAAAVVVVVRHLRDNCDYIDTILYRQVDYSDRHTLHMFLFLSFLSVVNCSILHVRFGLALWFLTLLRLH